MNRKKFQELYSRILRGDKNNIAYSDACDFVEELGFDICRQKGTSHRIYKMKSVPDIINLQNDKGNAKAYQVSQIRKVIEKYKIGDDKDEQG